MITETYPIEVESKSIEKLGHGFEQNHELGF